MASSSERRQKILDQVETALRMPSKATALAGSDLASEDFLHNFEDRLKLHWALTGSQMNKLAFEFALISTLRDLGFRATRSPSEVHPGADAQWEDERLSLKSEASESINKSAVHISKFSEARWIRDCDTAQDRADGTVALFDRHLGDYDRIFTLRSWFTPNGALVYTLVEIPKTLLARACALKASDFSAPTKNRSSRAQIRDAAGHKMFTVSLDGSVEKVTISSLAVSNCVTHAMWEIQPTLP